MKKYFLLIFILIPAFLFAATLDTVSGSLSSFSNVRAEGMGGVGVAASGRTDAYFKNPALIGNFKGQLSLPYFTYTTYNVSSLLQARYYDSSFEDKGDKLLSLLPNGNIPIAKFETGVSVNVSGLAFGINYNLKLGAMGDGGAESTVVFETDLVGMFALSQKFDISNRLAMSFGMNLRFHYKAYSIESVNSTNHGGFSAVQLSGLDTTQSVYDKLMFQLPVAGGFALPLDFGLALTTSNDFTFAFVVRNINGSIKNMETFNNFSSLFFSLSGNNIGNNNPQNRVDQFRYQVLPSYAIGLSWTPKGKGIFSILRPSCAIDIVNLEKIKLYDLSFNTLLSHLKFGTEIKFFNFLDFRAGLNAGYPTIGIGFDLFIFRLDAVYQVQGFGSQYGETSLDSFTVRINLGYDR